MGNKNSEDQTRFGHVTRIDSQPEPDTVTWKDKKTEEDTSKKWMDNVKEDLQELT